MRTPAQVGPLATPIDHHRVGAGTLGFVEALDDLPLVRLVRKAFERLLAGQLFPNEGLVRRPDLGHPRLDPRQVVRGERLRELEVVVEPVLDRGADRVLRAGDQVAYGLGQHVGGGMPKDVQPVGLVRSHGFHRSVALRDERQVYQHAVEPGDDRLGGEDRPDRLTLGERDAAPVGKLDLRHGQP